MYYLMEVLQIHFKSHHSTHLKKTCLSEACLNISAGGEIFVLMKCLKSPGILLSILFCLSRAYALLSYTGTFPCSQSIHFIYLITFCFSVHVFGAMSHKPAVHPRVNFLEPMPDSNFIGLTDVYGSY